MIKFKKIICLYIIIFCIIPVYGKRDKKEFKELEYKYSLIEGIKHKYIGNLRSSLALLKNSIDISDSSATAYYEIANIYILLNEPNEALVYSKKATLFDTKNVWFKFQYAQILIALDKYEECVEIYKSLMELLPSDLEIRYKLALIYIKMNENDKALKVYNDIENEFGIKEVNSFYKYNLFIESDEFDKAQKEIELLIKGYPENFNYLNYLANVYLHREDTISAVKYFNMVLEHENYNPIAISSLIEIYQVQHNSSEIINLLDQFFSNSMILENEKINFYIDFSQDLENYHNDFSSIRDILKKFSIGNNTIPSKSIYADFLIRAKFYDDAIEEIKKLIVLNKYNPLYYDQIINLYSLQRNADSVISYSNLAIELFKNNASFYLYAGLGYLQNDSLIESKVKFEKGLKFLNTDNEFMRFDFYTYLGDVCFRLNDYSCSDNYFNKALEIDSSNSLILNNYAYYLALREERLDQAERMSHKTVVNDSLSSTYLDTYAWVLYKMKQYDKSKIYIEKAIELGGNINPEILDHYGDILYKLDNIEDAKYFWRESIKFGGDSISIDNKLMNLVPVNEKK